MFGFFKKWAVDSQELSALMSRGEEVVRQLTKTNPKQLNPSLYNGLLRWIKDTNEELRREEQPGLNEYEAAWMIATFFRKVIEKTGDVGEFTEESYRLAAVHIAENYKPHIREKVRWKGYRLAFD